MKREMKSGLFGLVVLGMLLVAAVKLTQGCASSIDREDELSRKKTNDWLTFTQEHHCHVVHEGAFSTQWACDGFEVLR